MHRRLLRLVHLVGCQHLHRRVSSWQVLSRRCYLVYTLCSGQVVKQGRRNLCLVLHHMSRGQVRHGRLVVRILHRRVPCGQVQHDSRPDIKRILYCLSIRLVWLNCRRIDLGCVLCVWRGQLSKQQPLHPLS